MQTEPDRKIRRKRIWKRLLAAALTMTVLYIAAVNVLVSAVLVPSFMEKLPSFERITRKSYAEQVQETELQQNTQSLSAIGRGWSARENPQILHIRSEDGYRLAAAYFDKPGSHRWAVLLHGYTGSRSMMYEYGYWYSEHGYQVLVPDMRCQGESEGDYIGLGYTDSTDLVGWLGMILSMDPEAEVVLHGVSMGASAALITAARDDLPVRLTAVIADCAYTDAYEMFRYKIGDWFHLPAFPVVDSASFFIRLRAGYSLREASPLLAVHGSRVPTLFIHGKQDKMIPPSMTVDLYRAAGCYKELLIVADAGHAQCAAKVPEQYFRRVETFIERARQR